MATNERASFGCRLRQVRKRTGLNQAQFAELGGVKRVSQHFYEQDLRLPDLSYVYRLASSGVDIASIIFGGTAQSETDDQIPLKAAATAFHAMDELDANYRANLTSGEREQLFASLCRSLAANLAAPSSHSFDIPPTRQVSAKK